jgi:hypothetical protein
MAFLVAKTVVEIAKDGEHGPQRLSERVIRVLQKPRCEGQDNLCRAVYRMTRQMDHATLQARLAEAERHVAESKQRIVRQREVLRELERDAHADAAARARELLAKFEETLALHIADRDRLRKQFEMLQQSQQ